MKKYFLLLLFTALSFAQTTGVTKLKITANPEKTTATRVMVQDAATGEVGHIAKNTLEIPNANATTLGKIQLSGDLGGTATLPTVPGLATKENTIAPGTTSQYYRGDKTWQTLDKTAVGLGNVDNTSDLNKPISTATQTALNAKENTANKNTANGYAGLGSDGKLISSQLPSITISDTFVVGSQSAMLAVTAETGDVAVRTDLNKSFILKGTNPAVLTDWQELLSPTSTVTSVFGRTGAVTAQSGDYTTAQVTETTNKKYQTDAQALYNDATSSIQTQLNAKAIDTNVVHKTGDETVAGIKTFSSLTNFSASGIKINTNGWVTPNQVYGETGNFFVNYSGNGNTIIGNPTGNVGIGTIAPVGKLDVQSNGVSARFTSSSNVVPVSIFNTGSSVSTIGFKGTTTSNDYVVRMGADANNLVLYTSDTERIRINDSGNVGIGTISPSQKLEVNGFAKASSGFKIGDNGQIVPNGFWGNLTYAGTGASYDYGIVTSAGDGIVGVPTGTNNFQVSNKLGIGGISNEKLTITSGSIKLNSFQYLPDEYRYIGTEFATGNGNNKAEIRFAIDGSDTKTRLQFHTANGGGDIGERMRITSSGNIGIGTTSPTTKLDVAGTGRFITGLTVDSGTTPFLYFSSARTSGNSGHIKDDGNMSFVKTEAGGGFKWFNNSNILMHLDSGANLSIGYANPSAKLDVNGIFRNINPGDPLTGSISSKFLSYSANPYGIIFRGYATGMASIQSQRENSDSELFPLSLQPLGGNVIIGSTQTPDEKLVVEGNIKQIQNNVKTATLTKFQLAGNNTTTNISFDIANELNVPSNTYVMVEISLIGYGNSGTNGINYNAIVGGYSAHTLNTTYHKYTEFVKTIYNGSLALYNPTNNVYGVSVTNGNTTEAINVLLKMTVTWGN
jgi:hypothetical protein